VQFKEEKLWFEFREKKNQQDSEERLCQEGIELVCRESTGKNSFEF
jgi:hypothetical protein